MIIGLNKNAKNSCRNSSPRIRGIYNSNNNSDNNIDTHYLNRIGFKQIKPHNSLSGGILTYNHHSLTSEKDYETTNSKDKEYELDINEWNKTLNKDKAIEQNEMNSQGTTESESDNMINIEQSKNITKRNRRFQRNNEQNSKNNRHDNNEYSLGKFVVKDESN